MDVHPEHLVEAWHIVSGNGDEPIEWTMDQAMWDAVEKARASRECIEAMDPLPFEGPMLLLGTPVTITGSSVPLLRYRGLEDGKIYGTPVIGNMTEISPAIEHAHGRGTDAPR